MKKLLYFLILIIPVYALIVPHNKIKTEEVFLLSGDKKEEKIEKTVKLLDGSSIVNLTLEDYVIGVVSCEMPASYEIEALKSQAVAARTYALEKMNGNNIYDLENSTNNQCYHDNNKLKEKWGSNYDKYYNKVKNAVNDTSNEYMTYNGTIIKSFYFSTSNGKTEDVKDVFGSELDYLKSVDSSWDENNKNFEVTISLSKDEFLSKLGLAENEIINIEKIEKTQSGRINTIVINNENFKGTTLRKLLGLRSTDAVIEVGDVVSITTKGYGHGVGMSQYGANEMAKQGYNYKDILKHYYTGIEINNV